MKVWIVMAERKADILSNKVIVSVFNSFEKAHKFMGDCPIKYGNQFCYCIEEEEAH